ncbi:Triosephosphate isomerase [Kockiozyma suomiensis]|uniref:Triosephosphate isomerase n=1 Tax=Kockiozyma suomiensis TaxID=1337062 RepID=UPI0033434DAA
MAPKRTPIIGISLKMYFSPARTTSYISAFAPLATAASSLGVSTFVVPDFLSAPSCAAVLNATATPGTGSTGAGAQDCFWEEEGAYTGEVSPKHLAEFGIKYVELGHAERRRIFHETDDEVALKTAAATKNGVIPIICVGEIDRDESNVPAAVEFVANQIRAAVKNVPLDSEIILAYEPVWAIGQPVPAPTSYINQVCAGLRSMLDQELGREKTARIIYGGSAGPGLFTELDPEAVDGLFIGRFGHEPKNFEIMVNEIAKKKYV